MGKRDKYQEQTWRKHHERIMHVFHDHEPHSITEVSKLTKLTRGTIYKHINTLTSITWADRRRSLRPLYPMPEPLVQALYRSLKNWPETRAPSEIVLVKVPGHTERIDSNGRVNHIMQVFDSVRTRDACKVGTQIRRGEFEGIYQRTRRTPRIPRVEFSVSTASSAPSMTKSL